MSDFVEIQLDQSTVELGGVVRGRIRTLPGSDKLEKAKALLVELRCSIHGSGSAESITIPIRRDPGPLAQGYKAEFQVQLPEGPVSWQGRYVKVDWSIHVTADVPWAVDPKQDAYFQVVPRGAADAQQAVGVPRAS